ncbi:hypothetical protein TNCV_962531 [Trichonephila clavipes]|nr:hypothetical protein TNCV_962531 [Trichonephila clavipes]
MFKASTVHIGRLERAGKCMSHSTRRSSTVSIEEQAARRRATKSVCVVTTSRYVSNSKCPIVKKIHLFETGASTELDPHIRSSGWSTL